MIDPRHAFGVIGIAPYYCAANLNIHLRGLVLDGVYCSSGKAPVFHQAPAPTNDQLQRLLDKIINRILKLLTRLGHLIEEAGITYMALTDSIDPDDVLMPLQATSSTYRIALGPRAGRKVLSLQHAPRRVPPVIQQLCANAHGFSRNKGVRCDTDQRSELEQLRRQNRAIRPVAYSQHA